MFTALSLLVAWHTFRSAYTVTNDIKGEHPTSGFGPIPQTVSSPKMKLYGMAMFLTLLPTIAAYLFWSRVTLTNPRPKHTVEQNPELSPHRPPASKASLRERGLRLSEQIIALVHEREEKAPPDLGQPEVITSSKSLSGQTPPYMAETRTIFLQRFEGQVLDIHDEFSARGLQDDTLGAMVKDLSAIYGNVDWGIQNIADGIRKLAMLVPPDSLYAGLADGRLYQMAVDEANNSEKRARTALDRMSADPRNADAQRFFFYSDFKGCCLNQIVYLRAELIRRIGPSAIDQDEMRAFDGITDMKPNASISSVLDYIPRFRQLAAKAGPQVLPVAP